MATTTTTSTAPANYLPYGVTDLNRNYLWSQVSDTDKAKYTGAASTTTGTSTATSTSTTSTATSTSTTSTATSTTKTSTATGKFVSLGSTTRLSSSAFAGLYDSSRSAEPNSDTRAAFSKLWATDDDLHKRLGATTDATTGKPINGGAVFVSIRTGTVANADRPYNGSSGLVTEGDQLKRGKNPFGYFNSDSETPFVQLTLNTSDPDGPVTEHTWSADTGKTYDEWLKSAKSKYDQYETLIGNQQDTVTAKFGGAGTQAMLGFDVNNNGYLDSESELFGFDEGLSLDNASGATSIQSSTDKLAKVDFTFLTNGHLTGDPLSGDAVDRTYYSRFMTMDSNGNSTSLLQSQTGYSAGLNTYVTAQAKFSFDSTTGAAALTAVAQNGFKVTA